MKDIDDAQQTVLRLDQEQDSRPLSHDELTERRVAKEKTLALAIVQKIWLRQCSRLTWIKAGDANTKLFHM
jgi:hypothetical protein